MTEIKSQKPLRSEEVEDILARIPSWILRWGITFIFGAVVLLLIVSAFVKYPDLVKGRITIATVKPPIKVVVKNSGKIQQLFVHDNEFVAAGSYLAEIENAGTSKNVMMLRQRIYQIEQNMLNKNDPILIITDTIINAGDMQQEYNLLVKHCSDYVTFCKSTYYHDKITVAKRQVDNFGNNMAIILKQKNISENERHNFKLNYEINRLLFSDSAISKSEFKNIESSYLAKQIEGENINKCFIDSKIALDQHCIILIDLENEWAEKERQYKLDINNSIQSIRNQINQWEQKYILKSPLEGQVIFIQNWTSDQFIEAGEEAFAVINGGKNLLGVMYVPANGLGKLKIGQRVRIRLDAYPHEQYGQLWGVVNEISSIATNKDEYKIMIMLNDGLKTSYKKQLHFSPELKGSAEILTTNWSVLQRIFYNFKYLVTNNS